VALTEHGRFPTKHGRFPINLPRALSNQSRALSNQSRALSNQTRTISNQTRSLSNQPRALSNQPRASLNQQKLGAEAATEVAIRFATTVDRRGTPGQNVGTFPPIKHGRFPIEHGTLQALGAEAAAEVALRFDTTVEELLSKTERGRAARGGGRVRAAGGAKVGEAGGAADAGDKSAFRPEPRARVRAIARIQAWARGARQRMRFGELCELRDLLREAFRLRGSSDRRGLSILQ
jgi:hypothetical protein